MQIDSAILGQLNQSFCVGIDLSSRAVSSQVFSARVSLTSVFGMGTGGPSPSLTPTFPGELFILRLSVSTHRPLHPW